ncbi:MAG TPA: HD domain-containing phosphohydrolase [Caldisericia bacterium]|nr:HD domain-containing phosphohydrolase [Caldisericia bacterium]HPF48478.1 HD domain-containing phosphohydrolase [Caldisericia bacterium]HPI83342.1 HD domain-containing phosphohydrolase [Caldisericia bacterium]HPQ92932.1 HD domain-containing phosphohydrolase [Caldisericia bacterium]HRV73970.1 HD domain-containing phosphohydrolase [Caldisericia bacterium]
MNNEELLLEELASAYEQLNVFYGWYERMFMAVDSRQKVSDTLAKIMRATESQCGIIISLGRGKKLNIVTSWSSEVDSEQFVISVFKRHIADIESGMHKKFTFSFEEMWDNKNMQLLVVPWRSDKMLKGAFIYAREDRPYSHHESILLGNTSVQLGIHIDSSNLADNLKEHNQELGTLLMRDITEFDRLFEHLDTSDKLQCGFMSTSYFPEDVQVYMIDPGNWVVFESNIDSAKSKSVDDVLPHGIVDMVKAKKNDSITLPDGRHVKIESFSSNDNIEGVAVVIFANKNDEIREISKIARMAVLIHYNSQQMRKSLKRIYTSHLLSMSKLVDGMHPAFSLRSENIMRIIKPVANKMGLTDSEYETLRLSTLLIDIPLIYLGSETLERYLIHGTSTLNSGVLERIRDHPVQSADLLKHLPSLGDCIPVIRNHHERWDGLGYPDGLKGKEIPKLARIISLAQSLAFRTENHYTDVIDMLNIKEEQSWVERQAGRAFDPLVVVALFEALDIPVSDKLREKAQEG